MRVLSVVILAVVTAGFCSPARAGASLTFSPATLDLGRQTQNQLIEREVMLVNSGDAPLEILKVVADCGCTTPTLKETTLAPGASAPLAVRFDTRSYVGDVRRRIQLSTSAGFYTLELSTKVSPWKDWELAPLPVMVPPSLMDQTVSAEVSVIYHGALPAVALTSVSTDLPWLTAQLKPADKGLPAISLSKSIEAPVGTHTATLTLATSDPAQPVLTATVLVAVVSPVRIAPSPIVLPRSAAGTEVSATFKVLGWNEPAPPELQSEHGTLSYLGETGGEHTFRISRTAESAGNTRWLIKLKRAGRTELAVPISHTSTD